MEFEKVDLIKVVPEFVKWLLNFNDWKSMYGVLVGILVFGLVMFLIGWLASKLLTLATLIVETFQKFGITISLSGKRGLEIKQRQHFCRVIRADLEQITHSENWNDQWFTDLEAEVEADGRFYLSPLHKFFRKRSSGYRREPSLIAAIARATERHMLLIGDPGSGKSVALRHLALQFAEIGVNSRAKEVRIPLYINLREFLIDNPEQVNADGVKEFILENFRRGDSNTAQYIRKNWDDFLQRGTWFFLFDSFDEIPAVLHAEKGSGIIQKYSEAIRQFMSGMTECQGLMASREFKGPESIPWPKLRLLALDNRRQLELIRNADLSDEEAVVVRAQLATSQGGIYKNPLFLSLLCRFIKDHGQAPEHSHALLMDHVVELANRERDWVVKHTKLFPDDLLNGSEKIAGILAQEDEIGLAPTFNELTRRLEPFGYTEEQSFNLLNALIYVKIGRNDVKEARQGDKRFAFSHRRYQESLFVRHLVRNPNLIATEELLLNPKWREYTVALLQSQPVAICEPILNLAAQKIMDWSETNAIATEDIFLHSGLYFEWNEEKEVHLLNLLQEGMAQRIKDVPKQLSQSIESLVVKRWENGDAYDRLMSISLGGLVPSAILEARIVQAIDSGIEQVKRASFEKVAFLQTVPPTLADWVRSRIADETLVAADSIELSKLDLLVSRLPTDLNVQRVFSRNKFLRLVLYKFYKWPLDLFTKVVRTIWISTGAVVREETSLRREMVKLLTLQIFSAAIAISIISFFIASSMWGKFASVCLCVAVLAISCQLIWRESPLRITPPFVLFTIWKSGWEILKELATTKKGLIFSFLGILAFSGIMFAVIHIKALVPILAVGISAIGFIASANKIIATNRSRAFLEDLEKRRVDNYVLYARTSSELYIWLSHDINKLVTTHKTARSLLILLDKLPINVPNQNSSFALFSIEKNEKNLTHKNLLMEYLLRTA